MGYETLVTHAEPTRVTRSDRHPDVRLLTDAVQIMTDHSRFWMQIEIDVGTFDERQGMEAEDAHSGPMLLLKLCIQAHNDSASSPPISARALVLGSRSIVIGFRLRLEVKVRTPTAARFPSQRAVARFVALWGTTSLSLLPRTGLA
jgi:hypothetical protein